MDNFTFTSIEKIKFLCNLENTRRVQMADSQYCIDDRRKYTKPRVIIIKKECDYVYF